MAVPPVLCYRSSHTQVSAEMTAAGLHEITGKDVAVAIDGQPGERVPHADVVIRRNGLLPHRSVLCIDRRPCLAAEHHRLALESAYVGLSHQPRNAVDIGIERP